MLGMLSSSTYVSCTSWSLRWCLGALGGAAGGGGLISVPFGCFALSSTLQCLCETTLSSITPLITVTSKHTHTYICLRRIHSKIKPGKWYKTAAGATTNDLPTTATPIKVNKKVTIARMLTENLAIFETYVCISLFAGFFFFFFFYRPPSNSSLAFPPPAVQKQIVNCCSWWCAVLYRSNMNPTLLSLLLLLYYKREHTHPHPRERCCSAFCSLATTPLAFEHKAHTNSTSKALVKSFGL